MEDTFQVTISCLERFIADPDFTSQCGNDYPTTFYDAMKLINPDSWEYEEMFSFDPKSRDFLDKEVMSLTDDTFIRKTLEH